MPASGWSAPAGPSRSSRTPRRCARRSSGRPSSGSATATRRSWRWPSARGDPGALALPARQSRQGHADGSGQLRQGADGPRNADPPMDAVLREIRGAADAGLRRAAVPRSSRPQGRRILQARLGGTAAADREFPSWDCRASWSPPASSARRRSACTSCPAAIARTSACSPARRSRPAACRRRRSIPVG